LNGKKGAASSSLKKTHKKRLLSSRRRVKPEIERGKEEHTSCEEKQSKREGIHYDPIKNEREVTPNGATGHKIF